MLFDSILPTVEFLSELESSLQTLYQLNVCNILNPVVISTIFPESSPGVVFVSRNHFISSCIWSKSSSPQIFLMRLCNSHAFRIYFLSHFSCYFHWICGYFLHWSFEPFQVIKIGINFLKAHFNIYIWLLPLNHKCCYGDLKWWILTI